MRSIVSTAVLVALIAAAGCTGEQERLEAAFPHGETAHDGVVRIVPELEDVPEVPRWCGRLGLEGRRVQGRDAWLHLEEEGEGVPLLLLHGGPGGTHHEFHPFFSRAARFARVIYLDQRGCGLSDYVPGPDGYSVEQAVADLEAVREALGLERWALLGWSYGGFLAQLYTIEHPDRVAGLVLVNALPGLAADLGPSRQQDHISDAERERMDALGAEVRARFEQGLARDQAIALLVYNKFLNGDWKRQQFYRPSREELALYARYGWVNDPGFNSRMSASAARHDLTAAFAGCPIPTLVVEGRQDLTWGESKPDLLLANHPGARAVQLERSGHAPFRDEPQAFFAALEEFVATLPAVPAGAMAGYREHLARWRGEEADGG
jgi:proline iminopeptidase